MEYRQLGRTGVLVSALSLGCSTFGDGTGPEEACAILERGLDAGINLIDTANQYPPVSPGRSEEILGEALERIGDRKRVVLATKVHYRIADDDPNAWGNSRRHIVEQCEQSLRRLRTDHVDLYYVHRPQSSVPIDETLRALDDLIHSGKVLYIGTSTFAAWQLVESLWVARELGLNRFVCEQSPYNLLERRIERELLPMAQTYGFAVVAYSPLAQGLLTGKYDADSLPPAGSRFARMEEFPVMKTRWNPRAFSAIERLRELAADRACTMTQFSLAWCLQQPGITSVAIGPRTAKQLEDNLSSLEVVITDEDGAAVNEVVAPGSMFAPFYKADFGPHTYRW